MKKSFIIVFVLTAVIAVFTACSVNNIADSELTTAVTDEKGLTHYYEFATDAENNTVLNEIETDSKGNAVTQNGGAFVTKKAETTVTVHTSADDAQNIAADDNVVTFDGSADTDFDIPEPSTAASDKKNESTVTNQPVTDEDGWINKWY